MGIKTKSTYQTLYDLIEQSIYINQAPNVEAIIKYIKQNSQFRSLNKTEIEKIMLRVCTPYAKNHNQEKRGFKAPTS
jgi:hypothetical protein